MNEWRSYQEVILQNTELLVILFTGEVITRPYCLSKTSCLGGQEEFRKKEFELEDLYEITGWNGVSYILFYLDLGGKRNIKIY